MAFFQDKKLIVHVSLEIVILGTMTYFFHTKSKSLELRIKSVEEQFSKEITILQDNIVQLKKQLKKSDASVEEIKFLLQSKPAPVPVQVPVPVAKFVTAPVEKVRPQQVQPQAQPQPQRYEDLALDITFANFVKPPAPVSSAFIEEINSDSESDENEPESEKGSGSDKDGSDKDGSGSDKDGSDSLDKELEDELNELTTS